MKKPLYRLLYSVKMVFDISTFYNTTERVASLIVKITNQVIRSCKRYITENGNLNIINLHALAITIQRLTLKKMPMMLMK